MRSRRRRRIRYSPVMETPPRDLTLEELIADLDPEWADWNPKDLSRRDRQPDY